MARLPIATRESVPETQQTLFDELVQRMGSVPRYGPGSVMIHVPEAHRWATGLNDYLRNQSSLSKKVQELAMLVTARALDCQHIWNAHAASARRAGVPDALVDALRDRQALPALAPDEAAVVHYGGEFFRTHHVSRGAFQAALEQFGRQGAVELSLIMGNYSLLAWLINAFDTDLPRTGPNRFCRSKSDRTQWAQVRVTLGAAKGRLRRCVAAPRITVLEDGVVRRTPVMGCIGKAHQP